jgi:hypothetical protein
MTALRRTGPVKWTRVAVLVFPVGLFGCGAATPPVPSVSPHAVGANDPAWVVIRPNLPAPDTDRINYDARTRTLTFYELPGNDRWLVRLPGEPVGRQVAPQHRIPDVDLKNVMVYYTRPGMRPSVAVSVQQIRDSGGDHVSSAPK